VTAEKGHILLTQDAGLGFVFEAAAVEKYAGGPWSERRLAR